MNFSNSLTKFLFIFITIFLLLCLDYIGGSWLAFIVLTIWFIFGFWKIFELRSIRAGIIWYWIIFVIFVWNSDFLYSYPEDKPLEYILLVCIATISAIVSIILLIRTSKQKKKEAKK